MALARVWRRRCASSYVPGEMATKSSAPRGRRPPPRLAGRRLQMVAAVVRSPVTGRRLGQFMLSELGLSTFRGRDESAEPMRPAVTFRAAPRDPGSGDER